jgi:GNAT superfamily N-acetyltransferase
LSKGRGWDIEDWGIDDRGIEAAGRPGMETHVTLDDISIRHALRPGDIGYITYLHGLLYGAEYGFGIQFEGYVGKGLTEFQENYDPDRDRVWLCEHGERIVGSMFLMHREGNAAQLRYFLIRPEYRGIGLGKLLMSAFMDCLRSRGYRAAYLWTASGLAAASSLYRRHGFRLTEEKQSTTFGKLVTEQRYDLVLP